MTKQFILNFHGIGHPHHGVDEAERPYWLSESFFSAIVEMVAKRTDAEDILWTFDDGNASDLSIAAPILTEYRFKAQFFVLTGRLNDPNYLSPDDVRTLLQMGMEVGLHGRSHVDWRLSDAQELHAEVTEARDSLAKIVGRPIDRVAIPFGAYNRRVITHLKRSGFSRIYTSDGGASDSSQQVRGRTTVRRDTSMHELTSLIENRLSLRHNLRRTVSAIVRQHII